MTPSLDEHTQFLRRRRMWLLLSILGSFLIHILLLALIREDHPSQLSKKASVPVRIEIKTKKTDRSKEEAQNPPQIIEAPLPETEAPDQTTHLGAQNHRTEREQKTRGRGGAPGAPATALQNGPLTLERVPDQEGKVVIPKPPGKSYRDLLPQKLEVLNPGYNDYLPDKNLPEGPILDVNTTDYRFIGYFTAVRKSVDLAYFDIGPSLRDAPHVRGRLEEVGRVKFQGSSVVKLKIARSGVLIESKLIRSSGDKVVDEFWIKVLNLAAPYPPLPRDYPGDELVFTYTLYYDLIVEGQERKRRFVF